jgi:hypothetical protein
MGQIAGTTRNDDLLGQREPLDAETQRVDRKTLLDECAASKNGRHG